MEQSKIIEGNKLIAEFMGLTRNSLSLYITNEGPLYVLELKYHTSWEWLMPVVEKIEGDLFAVEIKENHCRITGYRRYENVVFFNKDVFTSKITATYLTVLDFIAWYNRQTPNYTNHNVWT